MEEIATFCDLDQFGAARTQFACGFFAVRNVWASVAHGEQLRQTPAELSALAFQDYARFDGSSAPGNEAGMTLQQLYDDLTELGLHFHALPTDHSADVWIKGFLALRWPVILAIEEASVIDKGLGRNPYPWTPRFNHIIAATGPGPQQQEILARDSANVDSEWVLRPGPRIYDMSILRLISVTAVQKPYSLPMPANFNPGANPGIQEYEPSADDLQVWRLLLKDLPFVTAHAIPQTWLKARWAKGWNFGVPMEGEHGVTRNGVLSMEQQFTGARASWDSRSGITTWWTSQGPVMV